MGDILGQYDWNDPALAPQASMTVENVLQQRHGLLWDELGIDYRDPENPVAGMMASDDWNLYVLTQPRRAPAGSRFDYSSGISHVMSALVRARTGMSPQAFAEQALFEPLGIDHYHIEA